MWPQNITNWESGFKATLKTAERLHLNCICTGEDYDGRESPSSVHQESSIITFRTTGIMEEGNLEGLSNYRDS
ncbi:unnamed protein product [Caretta caretta]